MGRGDEEGRSGHAEEEGASGKSTVCESRRDSVSTRTRKECITTHASCVAWARSSRLPEAKAFTSSDARPMLKTASTRDTSLGCEGKMGMKELGKEGGESERDTRTAACTSAFSDLR